jgi:hypothetical protein
MVFQKLNKKGLQLKNTFFAIIVVSMVIIAAGVIVGEWNPIYHSGLTYDLGEYNNLDDMASEAGVQQDRITPDDPDPGAGADFEGKMLRGGYGILGRIFTPFASVWGMFNSVEERFGLPSYVAEGVIALMTFALITTLIALFLRQLRSNV